MYKEGEYIHYGSAGLCRVEEITSLDVAQTGEERLYYRLIPIRGQQGVIFTPVDNQKVHMRKALSQKEAETLVRSIPDIAYADVPMGKREEEACKAAIRSADCSKWIGLIKTLHQRRESRLASGKKVTSTEEKYLREARALLNTELANAFGIRDCDVDSYIEEKLESAAV